MLARHGVEFHEIDIRSRTPTNVLRVVKRLDALLKEFKPDVVHAHMVAAAVVAIFGLRAGVQEEADDVEVAAGVAPAA